jgi:hypothetical protein
MLTNPLAVGLVLSYVAVVLFVFGFFLGDELSFTNPRYKIVVAFAVGWPLVLLYGLGVRLFGDEQSSSFSSATSDESDEGDGEGH